MLVLPLLTLLLLLLMLLLLPCALPHTTASTSSSTSLGLVEEGPSLSMTQRLWLVRSQLTRPMEFSNNQSLGLGRDYDRSMLGSTWWFPIIRVPQYRPQNTIDLVMGTPKKYHQFWETPTLGPSASTRGHLLAGEAEFDWGVHVLGSYNSALAILV